MNPVSVYQQPLERLQEIERQVALLEETYPGSRPVTPAGELAVVLSPERMEEEMEKLEGLAQRLLSPSSLQAPALDSDSPLSETQPLLSHPPEDAKPNQSGPWKKAFKKVGKKMLQKLPRTLLKEAEHAGWVALGTLLVASILKSMKQ